MMSLIYQPEEIKMFDQKEWDKRQPNETAYEWRHRVNGSELDPASEFSPAV